MKRSPLRLLLSIAAWEFLLIGVAVLAMVARARTDAAGHQGDFITGVPLPAWWLPLSVGGPILIAAAWYWRRHP